MASKTKTNRVSTAEFSAQYKSPLWQKKRLEILERDGFRCLSCGSKDKQLHVHHCNYYKGEAVYESLPQLLVTLCEDCHREAHEIKSRISHWSGCVLANSLLNYGDFLFSDVQNIVAFMSGSTDEVPDELKAAVYKLRSIQKEILEFMNGESK